MYSRFALPVLQTIAYVVITKTCPQYFWEGVKNFSSLLAPQICFETSAFDILGCKQARTFKQDGNTATTRTLSADLPPSPSGMCKIGKS